MFDTGANVDYVTIEGAMYSGFLSFDLIVSNSFSVGFSAGGGRFTKPGFVLFWECHQNVLDLQCCSDIKASGFAKNELNGIYTSSGNLINGRHLYVKQDKVFGIWFDGQNGYHADWILGYMTSIAEGKLTLAWAYLNKDSSCPSLNKEWNEWWNYQWVFSETAFLECLV